MFEIGRRHRVDRSEIMTISDSLVVTRNTLRDEAGSDAPEALRVGFAGPVRDWMATIGLGQKGPGQGAALHDPIR